MTGHRMTLPALTARERDVLALIAAGHTNQSIAETLNIALGTVKHHVARTAAKLGANNRGHAVRLAAEAGVLR